VGRELGVDVRLTGALGTQLQQVVVALAEWDQPDQGEQLAPPSEGLGVKPHALHEHIHPLIGAELRAGLQELLMVHPGHLDRLDAGDLPGAGLGIDGQLVFHIGDGPDATDEQLGVALHEVHLDRHLLEAEVGELHLVEAAFLVQLHGELVDHLVAAALFDRGFHKFRLVAVHVVLGEDPPHRLQTLLDQGGVISGAVLPEQVLEHVGGHHRVLLELGGEVLADHQAREMLQDLLIQGAVDSRSCAGGHGWDQKSSKSLPKGRCSFSSTVL